MKEFTESCPWCHESWYRALYLVCHGTLVDGQPFLYLERQPGEPELPIPGADLVTQIAQMQHRPLLVVLAACRSAGDDYAVLNAIGPQLARIGIGAVLAMQGDVPMRLVADLMPRLFRELDRDGQIDRALAAARSAVSADQPSICAASACPPGRRCPPRSHCADQCGRAR